MKYSVQKSIEISADVKTVFDIIQNLRSWPKWSPRLLMEPSAKVEFSDQDLEYSWDGEIVGAGRMSLKEVTEFNEINFDLFFERPFKSFANVSFELKELRAGVTEVKWNLSSSIPWFLFFMKKTMTTFIGMDYERGLRLLKDYCEKGEVESKTETCGEVMTQGFQYIGIKSECSIKDIGSDMGKNFEKLNQLMVKHEGSLIADKCFSIYHNYNPMKGRCEYSACFKVREEFNAGQEFYFAKLSGAKAFKVSHTGRYDHLGNAWSTGMSYLRTKKIKQNKKKSPIEFYLNDPQSVEAKDLKTDIYFPLHS